ncbi:HNH endonuclease [Prochlorococcus sp. MIT 1341]|uniref:HNH endonuclease n=1 Tax=Prochlorococcus sp. MIT 1341 TaxID=3096221 RepID=UPI002A75CC8D|nr:HNH endonuclease [Prochlorococcus sp. MIT 1341]
MGQVLVLNASYEPLNITTWRRAMVMMIKGKAESLEQDSSRKIRHDIMLPTVIRLRQFVRVPFRELPLTRRNILQRDNHCCQYCGYRGPKLSIDHVIPRSRGGEDTWENVTTACLGCNVSKGSRTPNEARMKLNTQPRRPHSSLTFEANRQIHAGRYTEWRKYVIGWNN